MFSALRELASMNRISKKFYKSMLPQYNQAAIECDFIFSLSKHSDEITDLINQVVEAGNEKGFNAL